MDLSRKAEFSNELSGKFYLHLKNKLIYLHFPGMTICVVNTQAFCLICIPLNIYIKKDFN